MGMAVLKLLLTGGIIFITAIAFFSDRVLGYDYVDPYYRLPDRMVPTAYNISLALNINETTGKVSFDGHIIITIDIQKLSLGISFHVLNLVITEIKLIYNNQYLTLRHEYSDEKQQMVVLNFNSVLFPGIYTLKMSYHSTNNNEGFFLTSYEGGKRWLAATTSLPTGARQLFPCWDEPAIKTKFAISVKVQNKYQVLTNMARTSSIQKADMKEEKFAYYLNMSTYQLAIIILHIDSFPIINPGHSDIIIRSRQNATEDVQFIKNVEQFRNNFRTLFNNSNWFLNSKLLNTKHKTDFVVIPEFPHDEMSHLGLVFYRERNIIYNEKLDPMMRKIEVARLVAHTEAQQWFGNLISPSWWFSWQIIEALTTFFGIEAINMSFPNFRIWELFVVQHLHESFYWNFYSTYSVYVNILSVHELVLPSVGTKNYQVIFILRMLQHLLTNKIFFKGVSKYISTHAYNTTTPDDLWITIYRTFYERKSVASHTIPDKVNEINRWIKMKKVVLKATRRHNQLNLNLESEEPIYILLTFTTEKNPNFTHPLYNDIKYTVFSTKRNQIILNDNGWVIINLQQTGYYRVNYDDKNWQKIATYLNSSKYTNIHVLNRAQIIDDAFYFTLKKQLNADIFWKLTSYLWQETDYIAWYPMLKALELMSPMFPLPDPRVTHIKSKLSRILNELLKNIKYEEKQLEVDSLTRCLRQEAAKWACLLGSSECWNNAKEKFESYISKETQNKVLPWWTKWTYCYGLILANSASWRNLLIKKSLNDINAELFCFKNPHHSIIILDYYFNMEVEDDFFKNSTEENAFIKFFIRNFLVIVARHAKINEVLEFTLEKLETIKLRQISAIAILTIMINNIYTEEGLAKVSKSAEKAIEQVTPIFLNKTEINLSEATKTSINVIKNTLKTLTNFAETGEKLNIEEPNAEALLSDNLKKSVEISVNQLVMKNIELKIKTRLTEIVNQKKYFEIFQLKE